MSEEKEVLKKLLTELGEYHGAKTEAAKRAGLTRANWLLIMKGKWKNAKAVKAAVYVLKKRKEALQEAIEEGRSVVS